MYARAEPPNSFDSATPTNLVIELKMVAKTCGIKRIADSNPMRNQMQSGIK
jgi:hypothetical protein